MDTIGSEKLVLASDSQLQTVCCEYTWTIRGVSPDVLEARRS